MKAEGPDCVKSSAGILQLSLILKIMTMKVDLNHFDALLCRVRDRMDKSRLSLPVGELLCYSQQQRMLGHQSHNGNHNGVNGGG